jgi:hypothetical protein
MEGNALATLAGVAAGIAAMVAAPRYVCFNVEVADIETSLELVESKGGQLPSDRIAFATPPSSADSLIPEGHLVGRVQQTSASQITRRNKP